MRAADLSRYVTTEDTVSLLVGGGLRNIFVSDAKKLITYYKNGKNDQLAEIVASVFAAMRAISSDPSNEAIGESTRLFEFLCLVLTMHDDYTYHVNSKVGYKLRIATDERTGTLDKQIVELHFGQSPDEDDPDAQLTFLGDDE